MEYYDSIKNYYTQHRRELIDKLAAHLLQKFGLQTEVVKDVSSKIQLAFSNDCGFFTLNNMVRSVTGNPGTLTRSMMKKGAAVSFGVKKPEEAPKENP